VSEDQPAEVVEDRRSAAKMEKVTSPPPVPPPAPASTPARIRANNTTDIHPELTLDDVAQSGSRGERHIHYQFIH